VCREDGDRNLFALERLNIEDGTLLARGSGWRKEENESARGQEGCGTAEFSLIEHTWFS
jgi:hypothetical protein